MKEKIIFGAAIAFALSNIILTAVVVGGKMKRHGAGNAVCTQHSECDDGNECTTDACAPSVGVVGSNSDGCVYTAMPVGTTCDDSRFCTAFDICDVNAGCVGSASRVCGVTNNDCTEFTCDEAVNECVEVNRAAGAGCNDGLDWTHYDVCNGNGICNGALTTR